ncbi:ParB/RepB/Spo0J family partition protein [Mesobacterium pallidum]|uniref:ParB/RepB/Spo0J family partition protein n=1 Tax=Mesobacterium pallidum TaxID=2872037 RepID=UPI001EE17C84|nr:ParB N-terminal domain-containing protein [Mesobacterium pallidum]
MSKKRRIFDIEFDAAEAPPAPAEQPESERRGPMASAIHETAEALTERRAAEARIREENDRLAHEFVALKKAGQIVRTLPLGEILTSKLTRDRKPGRDAEIDELKASLLEIGLSNPIRVEEVSGGYQLIQGWRRLTAYKELLEETRDRTWAEIPAAIQVKGEALDRLYQRMVDENLVRRDLSFGEMAQLAVSYAGDPNTPRCTPFEAVDRLYTSASRQKRSYIRHFTTLCEAIGKHLSHFDAVPRKLGLELVKRLDDAPEIQAGIIADLQALPKRTPEDELAVLTAWAKPVPAGTRAKPAPKSSAKTVIKLSRPGGAAKCTASDGRLELLVDRDFSALDRATLEEAVQALLDRLDRG